MSVAGAGPGDCAGAAVWAKAAVMAWEMRMRRSESEEICILWDMFCGVERW